MNNAVLASDWAVPQQNRRGSAGRGLPVRTLAAVATDDFLTASQAARFLGISRSTVRRAVAHGFLSGWHTPGRHLSVGRATCLEFAESLGRVDLNWGLNGEASETTTGQVS